MGARRVSLGAVIGALALAATLAFPGAAGAAETVIGFDNLAVGEEVTTQYEKEGLTLGAAPAALAPAPEDCGAPVVQGDPIEEPPSQPNYAVLVKCANG